MYQLFHLLSNIGSSLQQQLREQIASAILDGYIPPDTQLPSSRKLSKQLAVARNTVVLTYERLLDDGYLVARERSGYFVSPKILEGRARTQYSPKKPINSTQPDWQSHLKLKPSAQQNICKPRDWQKFPYCFIYGQLDPDLFPTNNWRECCRDSVSIPAIRNWAVDQFDSDDQELIEQIRTRLLPRRGVWAEPQQILVTVGAQQALFMIAKLLLTSDNVMGLEDPGYVDIRNIASLNRSKLKALPIDDYGLIVDEALDECVCIYVTPSHQSPTTVTMPIERRYELLKRAADADFILVEDDYEHEINFISNPTPALKSLDRSDHVLYIGSLSKTLAPGLRLGYMVGPEEFIREARALRRLILRHPAANNQSALARFLARGYHDSLLRNLFIANRERWKTMGAALKAYLPESSRISGFGGSSYWVKGPQWLDTRELQRMAVEQGLLIEPGDIHFLSDNPPLNYFRLGYSSIPLERIEPGIRLLAKLIRLQRRH